MISTESVLYCDFSFNATSREFFLAATIGLFLWIGCPSIPHSCYKLIFMSFYRLITFNNSPVPQIFGFLFLIYFMCLSRPSSFSCSKLDSSLEDGRKKPTNIIFLTTGMALWRDPIVYGYNSPLRSLKELVFGSWLEAKLMLQMELNWCRSDVVSDPKHKMQQFFFCWDAGATSATIACHPTSFNHTTFSPYYHCFLSMEGTRNSTL